MKIRNVLSVTAIIVFFILSCNAPAVVAEEESFEEIIKAKKEAIEKAGTDKEKAMRHKELGDLLISKDKVNEAAEEFIQALSLYRGFSRDERLQMAVYLSWAKRYTEAINELNNILSEDPENLKAQLQLARTLSWAGKNDEAIRQVDAILERFPKYRDALLTKANALRWRGNPKAAIPIYEELLAKSEDFDTRLGLTYAYLATGKREAALECSKSLKPMYPYQEKEMNELKVALRKAAQSNVEARSSYYHDTDGNNVNKYSLFYRFPIKSLKGTLQYTHTDARDHDQHNRAEEAGFDLYSKVTESLGIGGGAGFAQAHDDGSSNFVTWSARADLELYKGVFGGSVSRSLFSDTAELIDNRIMVTRANVFLSQNLTEKWFSNVNYSYRDYSDDNHSNDVQFLVRYAVFSKNPVINLGYRFRYFDFERQTRDGYFDPNDFVSNQVIASLYYERNKCYASLDPYFGYQTYRRYGDSSNEFVGGIAGSIGMKVTEDFTVEAYGEAGNFGVDTGEGFRYYLVGARLSLLF